MKSRDVETSPQEAATSNAGGIGTRSDSLAPADQAPVEAYASDEIMGDACDSIDDSITRLIRLSRLIKRHQYKKTNVTADQYEPKDDKGNSQVKDFETYAEWLLEDHPQFRLHKQRLKLRLQQSMTRRWRRTSYYTAKSLAVPKPKKQIASHPRFAPAATTPQKQVTISPAQPIGPIETGAAPIAAASVQAPSLILPSEHTISHVPTLSSAFKPQDDQMSGTSKLRLKSLAGTKASEFPPAPKIPHGAQEFLCPFCGSLQHSSMAEEKAWRYVPSLQSVHH